MQNSPAQNNRVRDYDALLFVIERFAGWSYLNLRLLSVRFDASLIRHQLVFLGQRFDLQNPYPCRPWPAILL